MRWLARREPRHHSQYRNREQPRFYVVPSGSGTYLRLWWWVLGIRLDVENGHHHRFSVIRFEIRCTGFGAPEPMSIKKYLHFSFFVGLKYFLVDRPIRRT